MEPSGGAALWPGKMTTEVCQYNKRRKTMQSSAVASELPDEIMTEVFLRLPIKSILRFRAVCKSWDALLSSEEFCNLHMAATLAAPTPPKLLFAAPAINFNYSTAVYSCSLSGHGRDLLFTIDDARGNFVDVSPASCHGLTLLYDAISPAYYVCNAATRAVTRLPPCCRALAATAGLGFDSHTKKYKVVRFFESKMPGNLTFYCEIYTLGGEDGDNWRPVAGGVPFRFCNFAHSAICYATFRKVQPVFADGFLHWMIEPSFCPRAPRAAVISFSLTTETFSWVRSPPFVASGAHLVKLDDHLCMVRDLRQGLPAGSMLEIWKLNDRSSGDWSFDLQIDLSGHVPRDFIEPRVVKVIGSFGSSKSNRKIIIATSKHKVFVYDPFSRTLETIHSTMEIQSSHQSEPSDIRFSLIRESLVPVHKTKEEVALSSPLAKVTKEILLKLPAQQVLNCKLVSKQWLRLIKSESFARSFFLQKNMDKRPKIMLVGKGTGQSGFSSIPLNKWIQDPSNKGQLLDTKVVCSKPCHGLNLVSIERSDYLYNPCLGFRRIYRNEGPMRHRWWNYFNVVHPEDHPFAVGSKNVGLGFNPLTQEHVIVELFYHMKNYESRQYHLSCFIWTCYRERQQLPEPPLPVNDMPPAYLEGTIYWMSEPRLGQSHNRAIVSFNIGTNTFSVTPCPPCIVTWSNRCPCHTFVVELEGVLCTVVADPIADVLDIWKWELGQWCRSYRICFKSLPDYSLEANIVVPLAVDPIDGRILLSTGRKLGYYNPLKQTIEESFALDQLPSTSSGKNLSYYNDQSKEVQVPNGTSCKLMPLVPMLYEESITYYPYANKGIALM